MYSAHHILIQKAGLDPSECEDAIGLRLDRGRICVADGATEAFDSRTWSRLLTKHWVRSAGLLTADEMEPWWATLGRRLAGRWADRTLPWYAEEKAAAGAFAAFVGIAFTEAPDGRLAWDAIALGDACLVHRRGASILSSMPLSTPDEFGYHPLLIPSSVARQTGLAANVTCAYGFADPGDTLVLLTDAVAAWYLRQFKEAPDRVSAFESAVVAGDEMNLREFITAERDAKRLRNDDVAGVLLRVGGATDHIVVG